MDNSKVQLRNNDECDVVGVGNVKIKMHNSIMRTLIEVTHVPELKKNLISLSTLNSTRCQHNLECEVLKVVQDALVMMRVIKHKGLYELQGEIVINFASKTLDVSI